MEKRRVPKSCLGILEEPRRCLPPKGNHDRKIRRPPKLTPRQTTRLLELVKEEPSLYFDENLAAAPCKLPHRRYSLLRILLLCETYQPEQPAVMLRRRGVPRPDTCVWCVFYFAS